jgi:hypothetical protein
MQAQMSGAIDITQNNFVTRYRNVSSIDTLGFNGGIEGGTSDGALRYALNVTGVHATLGDASDGITPLDTAPNIFGNARVSYDLPGLWPVVDLAGRFLATRPADQAFEANYVPIPYAPADVELGATVSGEVPKVPGLLYRANASRASSDVAPYVVGPSTLADPSCLGPACARRTGLLPVDTFRVMLGLQYDFAQ